jgi:hypothetical protein
MTQTIKEAISPLMKMEFNIKETYDLISSNKPIFWSWGVHDLTNVINKGLMFKVNGNHHKGWVLITLDWTDTYDMYLITTHGNIVSEHHNIYFDELVDRIDTKVEKISQYTF